MNYEGKLRPERTWQYGTKKQVKVLHVFKSALATVDDNQEGFILTGIDVSNLKEGQMVTMVFKNSRLTGGYWDIERKAK